MGITIVSKSGVVTTYTVKNNLVEKLAAIDRGKQIRESIHKDEAFKKYCEEDRKKVARNTKIEAAKKVWWASLTEREKEIQKTIDWINSISQKMWRSNGQDFSKTGDGIVTPEYRESYNNYLKCVREVEEYKKIRVCKINCVNPPLTV